MYIKFMRIKAVWWCREMLLQSNWCT